MENSQERTGSERILMPLCGRVINSDVSEDFTLPDYYPEIRRVLYVKESPLPPSGFVGGSKIDVNGVMDYTLVYVSGDGQLCSAPLSAEYSFSVPVEGAGDFELGEGVTLMTHTFCDSSNVRVNGPRKLSVRSHLRSCVNAWGRMICGGGLYGMDAGASMETLVCEAENAELLCESSDLITLSAQYSLPTAEHRVAMADGRVCVNESRVNGEIADVDGEVVISLTIVGDGKVENAEKRIPFEAQVELDGYTDGDKGLVRVTGNVTDLSLNIEEGRVDIEADLTLEVCYAHNRTVSYVKDAYSTECDGEAITRSYTLPTVAANECVALPLNVRISAEECGIPKGAEIVDIRGNAITEGIESGDNGSVIKGKCRCHIICLSDGEYLHAEADIPFERTVDTEGEPIGFDAVSELEFCSAVWYGDDIDVEAAVNLAYTVISGRETEMLEEMRLFDGDAREKDIWTVVYLTPDDSLWNIAKRYGVRTGEVKGDPMTDRYVIIER